MSLMPYGNELHGLIAFYEDSQASFRYSFSLFALHIYVSPLIYHFPIYIDLIF